MTSKGTDKVGRLYSKRLRVALTEKAASWRTWLVSGTLGNMAVLTAGVALAQLLTLAFSPLITRLYGPAAFGVLSVFVSVVAVVSCVATLSYSLAISLPRRAIMAYQLLKLALAIAAVVSLALSVLIGTVGASVSRILGLDTIVPYLWYMPFAVLLASVVQVLENWNLRERHFKTLARVSVLQAGVSGIARVLIGLAVPTAASLVTLSVLVQGLQAAALLYGAWASLASRYARAFAPRTRRLAILAAARRYRGFPLFRAPQVLLNVVSRSAPVVVLAAIFGPHAAGLYAIAQTVVYLPFTLIAQPLGQVLLQRYAAELHRGGQLHRPILQATINLAVVGAVPFGLIAILGPCLFGIAFGEDWREAGEYARWLSIWAYFNFFNVPAVQSLVVNDAQDVLLKWEVVTTASKILILVAVGTWIDRPLPTIAAYSLFGATAYVFLIASGLTRARRYEKPRRA